MNSKQLLFAAGFVLSCSGAFAHGDGTASRASPDASAFGHPGDPAKASRTIDVAASDDMRFTPASFAVGRGETIRFVVHNRGALEHELVVGTEQALRDHANEMRAMPGMKHRDANMVRVEPGGRGELTWTFDRAGRFSVACLVPGHYEAGMKGAVLVK